MTSFEDKISLMIPAYLRGELSESERQEVESLAAKNPEIAADIEFQRNLRSGLQDKNGEFEPGELGWARLSKAMGSANDVVDDAPARPMFWRAAAAVMAVAVVGQAGVIGTMASNDKSAPQYATVSEASEKTNIVKVGFNPAVTEETFRQTLQTASAKIVSGPSALGLYDVQFQSQNACLEAVTLFKTKTEIVDTVSSCE